MNVPVFCSRRPTHRVDLLAHLTPATRQLPPTNALPLRGSL